MQLRDSSFGNSHYFGCFAHVKLISVIQGQYQFFPWRQAVDQRGHAFYKLLQGSVAEGLAAADAAGLFPTLYQAFTDKDMSLLDEAGIHSYLPYSQVSSSDGVYGNGIWSATELRRPVDDEVEGPDDYEERFKATIARGLPMICASRCSR